MRSSARRAALLSAALIAAFACRGTRLHDATFAGTSVDLQYDLPREITSTTELCAGAHSILVSLDTTSGSGAQFSTLLFGTDGTLKGCGRPNCRNDVDLVFTGLKRVIVEWTDVTPAQYENSISANVVCRGVATDETNGTGAIPPFGGLSHTTDGAGVSHFHARLPVLRVGDLNPLFTTTDGAIVAPWAAASGFQSDLSGARTGTGGKIVVAGGGILGSTLKNTWIFDPRSISGSAGPDLGHERIGLTATDLHNNTGDYIAFIGGTDYLGNAAADADLLSAAGVMQTGISIGNGGHERAYHVAIPAPGGIPDAVLLAGGCNVDGASGPTAIDVFFLNMPSMGISSSNTCSIAGGTGPGACPSSAVLPLSCKASGGRVGPGNAVYLGGSYTFDFQPTDFFITVSNGNLGQIAVTALPTPPANRDAASAVIGTAGVVQIGGNALFSDESTGVKEIRFLTGTAPATATQLLIARSGPKAVTLLNGDILVTGGTDDTDSHVGPLELLLASNNLAPSFITRPGFSCNGTDGTGCVALVAKRSHHTATRINGTTSWLNGAVLLAGGKPLLFVPAYECDASNDPVRFDGLTRITNADYCDRGVHRPILHPTPK